MSLCRISACNKIMSSWKHFWGTTVADGVSFRLIIYIFKCGIIIFVYINACPAWLPFLGILKQMAWAAGGTCAGGVVAGPPGALVGGIVGKN